MLICLGLMGPDLCTFSPSLLSFDESIAIHHSQNVYLLEQDPDCGDPEPRFGRTTARQQAEPHEPHSRDLLKTDIQGS